MLALVPLLSIIVSLGSVRAQETSSTSGGLALPLFSEINTASGDDGTFQGTISQLVFSNDGDLILGGTLNGIVSVGDESFRVADQEFESPVKPSVTGAVIPDESALSGGGGRFMRQDTEPDPGKCDVLYLDIQPITLNLLGLEVLTSRITVDVNAIPGEGNLAGNLVCALAGLLDGLPDTVGEVTDQLNQIVEEAGSAVDAAQQDVQGLGNLPLNGTFEDESGETGTFQGTISDVVFSDDGGTIEDGVLNGISTVGDTTTRIVDQPITSPVTPGVGGALPIDQIGQGNGNGNGNSNGNGTGNQTQATTQPTTQPTAASTGSDNPTQPEPDPDKCDVLYLDIQPITLNLLGLEVLTSRITVDVNAIPGEGNLAGNLVCALAGLLDGTPDAVGQITDQLNQIMQEAGVAPAAADAGTPTDAVNPTTVATGEAEPTEAAGAAATEVPAEPTTTDAEPTTVPAEPTTAPAEPTTAPAEPTEPAAPTTAPAEPTVAAEETPAG
jgi:cell division septation protein DedD